MPPRDLAAVLATLARIRLGPHPLALVIDRALAFGRRANPPARCPCYARLGWYFDRCARCAEGWLPA